MVWLTKRFDCEAADWRCNDFQWSWREPVVWTWRQHKQKKTDRFPSTPVPIGIFSYVCGRVICEPNGSGMTTGQRMIEEKYVVSFFMRGGEWRIANNSGNQRWRGLDHRCAHRWSMEKSCYISWNDGFTVDSLAMTNGIIAVCRVKYFNTYDVLINSLYMTFILAVDNVFSKCKRFFGVSVLFVCTVRHKRIKRFVFIYNLYTSKL